MISSNDKINELIAKIRSGEIYGEIQSQYEKNDRKKKSQSLNQSTYIIQIQNKIEKKELKLTKILNDIIRLKNELSIAIEKELLDSKNIDSKI